MTLSDCPECQQQVSDSAEVCPHCGYPLGTATNPYLTSQDVVDAPRATRRPYYQYGLSLAATPMAVVGIVAILEQQGFRFSQTVLGIGMAACVLPATGLLAFAALDRFVLHRGHPAPRSRFDFRLLVVAIAIGAILLGLAMVTA